MRRSIAILTLWMVALGALVTGCGSSGGTSGGPTSYAISGILVDGAISNASCSAYQITVSGAKGPKLAGPVLTTSTGAYTLTTTLATPLMVECTGGSFMDWATGATVNLTSGDMLTAVGTTAGGSATMGVTPLTHMATALALQKIAAGATVANGIAEANGSIAQYFGLDNLLTTVPINPTVVGAGTAATQAQKNYALILAGIAKYAATNSITNPLDLVDALATDASDGTLDGMINATPVVLGGGNLSATAMTSGLAGAMASFALSSQNVSGVTATTDFMEMINYASGGFSEYIVSISLSPTSKTLTTAGETFTVGTKAINLAGTSASPQPAFIFDSSDESIATVDAAGLVTAVANGTASITAKAKGKSAACVVRIIIGG